MKLRALAPILLFAITLTEGCSEAPVIDQEVILTPDTLAFSLSNPDTQYLDISHSCTCPFQWSFTSDLNWINLPDVSNGDHQHVPFGINVNGYWKTLASNGDSNKLKDSLRIADTLQAGEYARDHHFKITSNFGDKEIKVVIKR
jgi:hypothetical protein